MKNYKHYVSMDLYGNGIGYNVVIVKEDENTGDVYFIKEEDLDEYDRKRMRQILSKRDAEKYPLWDLMSQTTLKNGVNALQYFHQLVQVRTSSGQIIPPSSTRGGLRPRPVSQQRPQKFEQKAPAKEEKAEASSQPKKKGPGRPPKKKSNS